MGTEGLPGLFRAPLDHTGHERKHMTFSTKFRVSFVDQGSVTLDAVRIDSEKVDWSQWTPWGQIKIGVADAEALAAFEIGSECIVSIALPDTIPTETREEIDARKGEEE